MNTHRSHFCLCSGGNKCVANFILVAFLSLLYALAILAFSSQSKAQEAPAAALVSLSQAIEQHANVSLLAEWRLDRAQLMDLLVAVRAARQAVTEYENENQKAAEMTASALKPHLPALKQSFTVDENVKAALASFTESAAQRRAKLLAAVARQINAVRRMLTPEQQRLVNWTRPAEVRIAAPEEELLEELRDMLADIQEIRRVLERIRYLIPGDYITRRVGLLREFLQDYYLPDTPEFNEALNWMIRLTDEMRRVPERDWPEEATLYVGRVWQYLRGGAPQLQEEQQEPAAPYNWWNVFNLLTDPQTPVLLQQLIGAGP